MTSQAMTEHPLSEDPALSAHKRRTPDGPGAEKYEVGYGKPPSASRFKKGMSGNPKGRPPGRRNLEALYTMMMKAALKGKLDEALKATTLLRVAESDAARRAAPKRKSRGSDLTDEEILQLVKERKLTWLALLDLYLDEKLAEETRERSNGEGGPSGANQGE